MIRLCWMAVIAGKSIGMLVSQRLRRNHPCGSHLSLAALQVFNAALYPYRKLGVAFCKAVIRLCFTSGSKPSG